MISSLKLYLAGGAIALLTFSHTYVYYAGKSAVRAELASDRITILKDGKEVDDAVSQADDDGLCAFLGGCVLPNLN